MLQQPEKALAPSPVCSRSRSYIQ